MIFGKRTKQLEQQVSTLTDQLTQIQNAVSSSDIVRGSDLFDVFTGAPSTAGPVVNERTAMSVSAVYACVALIAGAISGLPLPLYRRTPEGRERVDGHETWRLLNEEPTPAFSSATFWEYLLTSVLLNADGFAEIHRNGRGDVTGFVPHHPRRVEPRPHGDRLIYVIYPDAGSAYAIDQDDMLHIPGVGYNGVSSLSPISYAAKNAIGTAIAASEYNAEFFANGARADFALKTAGKLDEQAVKTLRETWYQRHQGRGNRHMPAVLTGGLDVAQLTMSAQDSQLIDVLRFQIVDIARAYGVPPHMIAETGESTTWGSGIEQLTIGFVKFAMRPHLNRIQREINRKLFRRSDLYMEFNVEGLLRGDSKAQSEYFAKALGGPGSQGWMSVDEVRRLQNLPPMGGDFANVQKSGSAASAQQPQE